MRVSDERAANPIKVGSGIDVSPSEVAAAEPVVPERSPQLPILAPPTWEDSPNLISTSCQPVLSWRLVFPQPVLPDCSQMAEPSSELLALLSGIIIWPV